MNMSTTDITRNYRSVMMIIYPEYYLAEQDSNYIQWLREQSCQGYPYCPWTMGSQLELQIEFPKQMLDHALTLKELKCNFIWGCFRWGFFTFQWKSLALKSPTLILLHIGTQDADGSCKTFAGLRGWWHLASLIQSYQSPTFFGDCVATMGTPCESRMGKENTNREIWDISSENSHGTERNWTY